MNATPGGSFTKMSGLLTKYQPFWSGFIDIPDGNPSSTLIWLKAHYKTCIYYPNHEHQLYEVIKRVSYYCYEYDVRRTATYLLLHSYLT